MKIVDLQEISRAGPVMALMPIAAGPSTAVQPLPTQTLYRDGIGDVANGRFDGGNARWFDGGNARWASTALYWTSLSGTANNPRTPGGFRRVAGG